MATNFSGVTGTGGVGANTKKLTAEEYYAMNNTKNNVVNTNNTANNAFIQPTNKFSGVTGTGGVGATVTAPTALATASNASVLQQNLTGGAGETVSQGTVNYAQQIARLTQQIASASFQNYTPQQQAMIKQQLANAQAMVQPTTPTTTTPTATTPTAQTPTTQMPTAQEQLQQQTTQQNTVTAPDGVTSLQTGQVTPTTSDTNLVSNYQSPYASVQQDLLQQLLGNQFSYDPATDTGLQQAGKEMENQVMNTMVSRGILNSTITGDTIAGGWAKLIPEYESVARGNWDSEQDRLTSLVSIVNQLDQQSYDQMLDQWTADWQQKEFDYNAQMDQIELDRQEIADAWTTVKNLGYVDDATSIILGLPVGTRSAEAQQAIDDMENELLLMKEETKQALELDLGKLKNEASIMSEASESFTPTTKQLETYNKLKANWNNIGWTPAEQLSHIAVAEQANPTVYKDMMGETLYNQLVSEIQEAIMYPAETQTVDVYSSPLYEQFAESNVNTKKQKLSVFKQIIESSYDDATKEATINAIFKDLTTAEMQEVEKAYVEAYR